jgi:hypothetical protein
MMVSWFEPQNQCRRFGDLDLKITVTVFDDLTLKIITIVSWFGHQNQIGEGLSVYASKPMSGWSRCENTRRHPVACFVANQVGLGFPSFGSKVVEERRRVVHMTSSPRSRGSEAKDGRFDGIVCGAVEVGANYHLLDVISL